MVSSKINTEISDRFIMNTARIFGGELYPMFEYGFTYVQDIETLMRTESYLFGTLHEALSREFNLVELTSAHEKAAASALMEQTYFQSGYTVCLLRLLNQDVSAEIFLLRMQTSALKLPTYYDIGRSDAATHFAHNLNHDGFLPSSKEFPKLGNFQSMIRAESVEISPLERFSGKERKGFLSSVVSKFGW